MSCGKNVPQGECKIFAEVFCCERCHAVAERFMERAERDLSHVRTMMKETVRHGLLQGKLQFSTAPPEEVSRKDFINELVSLAESAKKNQCLQTQTPTPPSGQATKLLAPIAEPSKS